MKVLVLGHSNSEGVLLADKANAWPNLLRGLLTQAGMEAEVVHRRMFAGPSAPSMLRQQVEKEQPDVVILATSTYGVVVRLISNRVRERWGERAGRYARSIEDYGARRRRPRRRPTRFEIEAFLATRRVVRKVLGTSPTHSVNALAGYYEECLRVLAQFEAIQGIVLTGCGYGPAVDALNPGWETPQDAVYARVKAEAHRHRFAWVSHIELMGGPEGMRPHFGADGIHTDEETHRAAAAALAMRILAPVEVR